MALMTPMRAIHRRAVELDYQEQGFYRGLPLAVCAAYLLFRAKVTAGWSCADDAAYFGRSRTVYLPFTASHQKPRRLTWAQEVSRMLFEGQVGK
jgi:hypothetical protein